MDKLWIILAGAEVVSVHEDRPTHDDLLAAVRSASPRKRVREVAVVKRNFGAAFLPLHDATEGADHGAD